MSNHLLIDNGYVRSPRNYNTTIHGDEIQNHFTTTPTHLTPILTVETAQTARQALAVLVLHYVIGGSIWTPTGLVNDAFLSLYRHSLTIHIAIIFIVPR